MGNDTVCSGFSMCARISVANLSGPVLQFSSHGEGVWVRLKRDTFLWWVCPIISEHTYTPMVYWGRSKHCMPRTLGV